MKKRKLSEKQTEEINFLCEWVKIVAAYFVELGHESYALVFEPLAHAKEMGWIAGVREGYNDNNLTAIEELSADQLAELNRRLKAKFGKTLWDVNKKMETKITNIAKRGTLRNDEEFYLARNYIDTIADVADKAALCSVLEKITEEYEMAKS